MHSLIPMVLLSAAACLVAGCAQVYDGPPADLVIVNAKILTLDPDNPEAQAVAVIGETIVAVGSEAFVRPAIQEGKTQVIDALGMRLIPGFNDAHAHFLGGGRALLNLDFRYIDDPLEIQRMVAEKVRDAEPGEPIIGRGWDHELFPNKAWPTKEILDAVAPNNPVVLFRTDGHSIWVNGCAMRLSGVTRHSQVPEGGTMVVDPVTGEPTGIFKEAAEAMITVTGDAALSPERQKERDRQALEMALDEARRLGVTSVQHLNLGQDLLQEAYDQGKLTARVTFQMTLTDDSKPWMNTTPCARPIPRRATGFGPATSRISWTAPWGRARPSCSSLSAMTPPRRGWPRCPTRSWSARSSPPTPGAFRSATTPSAPRPTTGS